VGKDGNFGHFGWHCPNLRQKFLDFGVMTPRLDRYIDE
jgi:hypothetical protein